MSTTVASTYEVKKSRFVSRCGVAESWEAAKEIVDEFADKKARHNCYAWVGLRSARSSDDGEPSGTAAKPIREAIATEKVNDVVVLVTRYKAKGAPQLGAGGLIRAYGTAARMALKDFRTIKKAPSSLDVALEIPLKDLGRAQALLSAFEKQHFLNRISEDYGSHNATMRLQVAPGTFADLTNDASRALGASAKLSIIDLEEFNDNIKIEER